MFNQFEIDFVFGALHFLHNIRFIPENAGTKGAQATGFAAAAVKPRCFCGLSLRPVNGP